MKRTAILTILTLLLAPCLVSVEEAEARGNGYHKVFDIPTALVVDTCRTFDSDKDDTLDQVSEVTLIDFLAQYPHDPVREVEWWPGDSNHGGVSFASLPGFEKTHVFITEGSKLKVYDIGTIIWSDPETSEGPFMYREVRSVDVGALVSLAGFELARIATGRWVGVEAGPNQIFGQAALYLVGTRPNEKVAYYVVLDQKWLIEGNPPVGGTNVYGFGQICSSPTDCVMRQALDLRVGDRSGVGFTEEAYITLVEGLPSGDRQSTFRLERGVPSTAFNLTHQFDSLWLDPDEAQAPPKVDSAGLRFAPGSHDAYVPRKYEATVRGLTDGYETCPLAGEPVDVAVWEPGISAPASRYLLVPTWDGSDGILEIVPAPDSSTCTSSVKPIEVGVEPTSIDIYPVDDDEFWALVVSRGDHLFEAIRIRLVDGQFQVIDTRPYDMSISPFGGSCPSYVHFGLRDLQWTNSPGSGLDRKCAPYDPRCPPELRP